MIRLVEPQDFYAWLELAKEVEPLFGAMVENEDFRKGIAECISNESALCVVNANNEVEGIVAVNKGENEISWLAVKESSRGKGYGCQLLKAAIACLDNNKPMFVQTFSSDIKAGEAARKVYLKLGFEDFKPGGKNPAGIETTIMTLDVQDNDK